MLFISETELGEIPEAISQITGNITSILYQDGLLKLSMVVLKRIMNEQ